MFSNIRSQEKIKPGADLQMSNQIEKPTKVDLKVTIQNAYDNVDQKNIKKAIKQWSVRVAKGIEVDGGHIEQHLGSK